MPLSYAAYDIVARPMIARSFTTEFCCRLPSSSSSRAFGAIRAMCSTSHNMEVQSCLAEQHCPASDTLGFFHHCFCCHRYAIPLMHASGNAGQSVWAPQDSSIRDICKHRAVLCVCQPQACGTRYAHPLVLCAWGGHGVGCIAACVLEVCVCGISDA